MFKILEKELSRGLAPPKSLSSMKQAMAELPNFKASSISMNDLPDFVFVDSNTDQ
jgi:hypothetical protein